MLRALRNKPREYIFYRFTDDLKNNLENKNVEKELFNEIVLAIKSELTEKEFNTILEREDIKEMFCQEDFVMENGLFVTMLLDIAMQKIERKK